MAAQKGMAGITVVGIGPGSLLDMTPRARAAIERAQVVAGYTTYIRLIEPLLAGKEVIGTGMMHEIDRCRMAVEAAASGKETVVVSSGDAGVYGMAGLVLELVLQREVAERPHFGGVIAGVSAVNAAASILGAPLMHDFAVISLSDLLTPWEDIERRIEAAAWGDFCIALYNPRSKKRSGHLARAVQVLLRHKGPDTVCGWVRMIGREGQQSGMCTLDELGSLEADMFTTVFVGNAATRVADGRMVTPRGYRGLS